MKKTYLARRNALLTTQGISWSIGALLFALAMFVLRFAAPVVFWHVFTPVFRVSDAIAEDTQAFFSHFNDAAKLTILVEKLTAENAALSVENQTLRQKNADIEALFAGAPHPRAGISAQVVARPPMSPYDRLVLGKGSVDGIVPGMEAFGPGAVPVGIVSAVMSDFSEVTLFSTGGIETNGWVGARSLPLTLIGAGAGAFKAAIARDANISVGDIVSVPGPGQLPLGSVARIDDNPLSSAVTLRIISAANPFSLTTVELRSTGISGMKFSTSTLP